VEANKEEEYELEEVVVVQQEEPQEPRKLDILDAAPLALIAVDGPLAPLAVAQNLVNVQEIGAIAGKAADLAQGPQCCECLGNVCAQDVCSTLFFVLTIPCRLSYLLFMLVAALFKCLYSFICHPICCFWCDKDGSVTASIGAAFGSCAGKFESCYTAAVTGCSGGLGSCALGLKDNVCIPCVLPVKDFIVSGLVWLITLPFKIFYYIWLGLEWPFQKICGPGACSGVDNCFHGIGNFCGECKTDCYQCCACHSCADISNCNCQCCECHPDLCHACTWF